MTTTITIEQQVEELRAEYGGSTSNKERKRIWNELWLCELMLLGLEWKAQREASQVR